jgi:hypothetical protein
VKSRAAIVLEQAVNPEVRAILAATPVGQQALEDLLRTAVHGLEMSENPSSRATTHGSITDRLPIQTPKMSGATFTLPRPRIGCLNCAML